MDVFGSTNLIAIVMKCENEKDRPEVQATFVSITMRTLCSPIFIHQTALRLRCGAFHLAVNVDGCSLLSLSPSLYFFPCTLHCSLTFKLCDCTNTTTDLHQADHTHSRLQSIVSSISCMRCLSLSLAHLLTFHSSPFAILSLDTP